MKTFGSFTITLAMMVALTVALIAGPVEANRFECGKACGVVYQNCIHTAKPRCLENFGLCLSDCDS
ncbi:MAG: hypothetical protein JOS17DRAFT_793752 [Linnemannia elongata]|nr:MAG: hypothetical protein JOS17DRAFT_793752 [Linnemannia elongata]